MLNFAFLLEGGSSNNSGSWVSIVMIVLLFVMLYFFMIRPQKKQQKRDEEMRGALQVGDEVTTIGGIIGKVISIKGETFVLETTKDKTKIRFLKGAIRSVDVKAADIAAQVMEANQTAEAEAEATEPTKASENTENAEK
ncbi:MAG: preprotein translocase subunit YajC [Clostridia bacterium]|nr:preprotein translocase subunit YajC [Clostridia bacterium]